MRPASRRAAAFAASPAREEVQMGEEGRGASGGHWTFFTNHAHVLFVLAQQPDLRLRDVAERVDITERAAQRIVRDLEEAGYVQVQKSGRRNTYVIHPQLSLRHPVEAHCSIDDLLRIIGGSGRARHPRAAPPRRKGSRRG
jgi:hypothetical protein